jgi:pimeloyl-ACP methyl ester carboxylesterase
MTPGVSRHFATVGQRQVHYRRAGSGDPVVLLHQSPTSSAELLPLMRYLAPGYTVLAPDMPGYGASDPLAEGSLSVPGLVDNLAAFMDELGVAAAAIYGFHTGASIACSMARRHPGRVSVAICEGLLRLDDTERSELLLRYIEPFEPRWDGGHLSWLWSRLKDQSLFFPWYERSARARLALDGAMPAMLAARALDWLRCGERYGEAYAAAMRYDPLADLARITVPLYIIGRRADPLSARVQQLPRLPASCEVRLFDGIEAGFECVLETLKRHPSQQVCPAVVPARPIEGQVSKDYVNCDGLQLRLLQAGQPQSHCLLIQHGAQRSLRSCADLVAQLGQRQFTLALEAPGHGESDAPGAAAEMSIEQLGQLIAAALGAVGTEGRDLIGIGAGAAVQVELARRLGARVRSLTLVEPVDLGEQAAQRQALYDSYASPHIDFYGGYLLRAWHEVRDHLLFFPWFERQREYAVLDSPMLEAELIHARTVELLLSGESGVAFRRAELRYPLRERLAAIAVAPGIAAARWEPRFAHSRTLAGSAVPFLELARDSRLWGAQLISHT